MPKFKIAFLEIEPWEKEYIKKRLKNQQLFFLPEKISKINLKQLSKINILSPFIYSPLDEEAINYLKSLKFIATRSTGFDHIDLATAKKRKILVANVPTYGENTVAEHTFALILALSRKIVTSIDRVKTGNFSLDHLRGFDLQGKTIGVVGAGNIGQHVIRIANGFGMQVLAFDVKQDAKLAKDLNFRYATLSYLFKHSDIVTLHVPENKFTHHLINLNNLKLFKNGCYLINTARGAICETEALLQGLKSGIFAGLGLDVLEGECFIKEERELLSAEFKKTCDLKIALGNHVLINQPNVIITAHNAFNSQEALTRILDTTIKNIQSFSRGKPVNLVN